MHRQKQIPWLESLVPFFLLRVGDDHGEVIHKKKRTQAPKVEMFIKTHGSYFRFMACSVY